MTFRLLTLSIFAALALSAGASGVQPSVTAWQEIFPRVTQPSQLVVASTSIDVVDQSGLEFNRAGDDGDTLIYFHSYRGDQS